MGVEMDGDDEEEGVDERMVADQRVGGVGSIRACWKALDEENRRSPHAHETIVNSWR